MSRTTSMEESVIQSALQIKNLTVIGAGTGCISSGTAYQTDDGKRLYAKRNCKEGARLMFDGEFASLKALNDCGAISAPKPIKVLNTAEGGSLLIMDYLTLEPSKDQAALGHDLARLHLSNLEALDRGDADAVTKFGFHVPTCCGFLPQTNEWRENWVEFFCEKIDWQINQLSSSESKDVINLWNSLRAKIGSFFTGLHVRPSLLHGDLWSGNSGQSEGKPVIFDPASFYGHHEYDMGIATMFGGFNTSFYTAYHKLIPKADGFDTRNQLYQLFHNLNHWTHFGSSYQSGTLEIMKTLLNAKN